MYWKYLIITLLLFSHYFIQAQGNTVYKAIYQIEFKKSDNDIVAPAGMSDFLTTMESLEYELIFNNEKGVFRLISSLSIDDDFLGSMLKAISVNRHSYYYNLKEKSYYSQNNNDPKIIRKKIPSNTQKWNISGESRMLSDMECMPAQMKSTINTKLDGIIDISIHAYFTRDIPVSFGPEGYHGLPGLIVQLEDRKKIWRLRKIQKIENFNYNDFNAPVPDIIQDE